MKKWKHGYRTWQVVVPVRLYGLLDHACS